MFRDNPEDWAADPKDGTWPNCIWDRRKSLPAEIRRTIEKGANVLKQLEHKLNIGRYAPSANPPKTAPEVPAVVGSQAGPADPAPPPEPPADGPIPPNGFRSNGQEYRGIAARPFLALSLAWPNDGHCLDVDDFLEAIGEDAQNPPRHGDPKYPRRAKQVLFVAPNMLHAIVRQKGRYLAIQDGTPRAAKNHRQGTEGTKQRKRR